MWHHLIGSQITTSSLTQCHMSSSDLLLHCLTSEKYHFLIMRWLLISTTWYNLVHQSTNHHIIISSTFFFVSFSLLQSATATYYTTMQQCTTTHHVLPPPCQHLDFCVRLGKKYHMPPSYSST